MACNHDLGRNYVGLYCIYCRDEVAVLQNDGGQLKLAPKPGRSGLKEKYVAVIYKGRPRVLNGLGVNDARSAATLTFGENESWHLPTSQLLLAFQDPEEKLVYNGD